MVEEGERNGKKLDEDVMFEIDNSFRFLFMVFGNIFSIFISFDIVKFLEI